MSQEPELPFERCPYCNGILPWPGIPFPRVERMVLDTIHSAMVPVPTVKHLARLVGQDYGYVRTTITRINRRLKAKGLKIVPTPLRIVQITELGQKQAT